MQDQPDTEALGSASSRLRGAVVWLGILFFGALAILATIHYLDDILSVLRNTASFTGAREMLIAAAVIIVGAVWLFVIARVAARGQRAAALAAIAAFITLLAVRLLISFTQDGVLSGEPGIYNSLATKIAEGPCCPWDRAIDRPPGYQFLLAGAYAIGGRSALTAELLNILFAIGAGLAVFGLGRKLYGPQAGAVALTLYALWPAGALMIAARLPHTSYDLAIAAAALAIVAAPAGWRGSALGGVLLGLSQYLRPSTLLLLPVFLIARIWDGGPWRKVVKGAVLPMIVAYLIVLVPIMAWNVSTRGVPDVTTSAHGGKSLYVGTDIEHDGTWSAEARDLLIERAGSRETWARSAVGQELALERLKNDPIPIFALAIRKQDTLWGGESFGVRYAIKRNLASRPYLPASIVPSMVSGAFYVALLMATAAGLYLGRRQPDALMALLILTALMVSLAHGFLEVRDRYHSYVIPLAMPIAAFAISAAVNRIGRRGLPVAEPAIHSEQPDRGEDADQEESE